MTRRRRGFTLLEILLAMTIAATIALVLYSTLATAFRARTAAIGQTASMREAAIALDLIEADLENAKQPVYPEPTAPALRMFGPMVGEADSLSLYTLGRDVQANAAKGAAADVFADGVRQVAFSLADDKGTRVLSRGVQRNVLATATAQFEDESLAGGVTALVFRYYDGTQWLDAWHSDDEDGLLPLAIEVSIDLTTKDRGVEKVYKMSRTVPIACADATLLAARGAN